MRLQYLTEDLPPQYLLIIEQTTDNPALIFSFHNGHNIATTIANLQRFKYFKLYLATDAHKTPVNSRPAATISGLGFFYQFPVIG